MAKILISLRAPAVSTTFDVFVPNDLDIGTLTTVLASAISESGDINYTKSGNEMLMQVDPDLLLNPRLKLEDYGFKDGVTLLLV